MKTKADGVPKAFEPYKQGEVDLVLSLVPTHANVRNLALALGRSKEAIYTIYHLAYKARWLKQEIARVGKHDNIYIKIARAKKRSGLFLGHNPQSIDAVLKG